MFKKPVAVELEAINQEGEIQVVRDSGLTVQGCESKRATAVPWQPVWQTTTPSALPTNWRSG